MAKFKGSHCRITGVDFTLDWMGRDRIALKTGDRRITKPGGARPGIWVTASSNPDSADYHPNNFNRWAEYLSRQGLPAPDLVPEHPRRLDRRWALLSQQLKTRMRRQDRRTA
jgi:hypothetical protein